jgi:hypothetical protein
MDTASACSGTIPHIAGLNSNVFPVEAARPGLYRAGDVAAGK